MQGTIVKIITTIHSVNVGYNDKNRKATIKINRVSLVHKSKNFHYSRSIEFYVKRHEHLSKHWEPKKSCASKMHQIESRIKIE